MMQRPQFNPNHAHGIASVGGHRRITLICPACRQTFTVMPAKFAQAKKRSGGRPMTCSQSCRWGLERDTKAAQRAQDQG